MKDWAKFQIIVLKFNYHDLFLFDKFINQFIFQYYFNYLFYQINFFF